MARGTKGRKRTVRGRDGMANISQREAQRLKKRVAYLEKLEVQRRMSWTTEYPGSADIGRHKFDSDQVVPVAIRTARKLRHFVIAVAELDGTVRFIADVQPSLDQ